VSAGACPSLADLLLAAEGELPPVAQETVSAHLVGCSRCQATLNAGVSFLGVVRQVMKPFGERDASEGAEARFQRFLVQLHARKQQRIHRAGGVPFRRWFPLAATILLGSLFFLDRHTVIEADELVEQAASVERARHGMFQRLRLTQTPADRLITLGFGLALPGIDLEATDGIVTTTKALTAAGSPATLAAQLLARHRFSLNEPLSVARFNTWRAGLAHKRDEVTELRGSGLITLRTTTTDDGELREVELTVYRDSYRVKSESFRFEGAVGLVTIEENLYRVRPSAPPVTVAAATTTTVTPVTARPTRLPIETAKPTIAQPDLFSWRYRKFGNSPTRDKFMPDFRRLTHVAAEHLVALRELSTRYPGADGPQFSPAARARLQRQLDLQYQTLRRDLDDLQQYVLVLTLQPGTTRQMPYASKSAPAPEDWSRRVDAGLAAASTLDRLAGDLQAYNDLPTDLQQQVAAAFDALLAAIYR
jgi:hypothetical protein